MRKALVPENRLGRYFLYAIGEIILVVMGILIALQINTWNQEKKNRVEERLILSRLNKELDHNTNELSRYLSGIEKKEKALKNLASTYKGRPIVNDSIFLSEVITSSLWGWTVQPLQRLVFDELSNTGKLVLIQNLKLREEITELYNFVEIAEGTALARTGDFSKIVYALIPRQNETQMLKNLTSQEMGILVKNVLDSNLNQSLVYEQNRTNYLKGIWNLTNGRISEVNKAITDEIKLQN